VIRLAVVLGLVCACGPAQKPDPRPDPIARQDDPTCPVLVAGTSVTVEDTDQGAALVFVTTGDAAAVRMRATALAEMHNHHHASMTPGHDAHAGHEGHMQIPDSEAHVMKPMDAMAMGSMISIHSTAAATEAPNGARVTFTAASADDVSKLQSELRMHAQHLAGGTCVM
jgi:hypothetical protein